MRAHFILRPALAGALVAAGPAAAQTSLYTEGPTLEFRSEQPWATLELVGSERVQGVSPLRVPGPLSGNYWLLASGPGAEDQRGRVRIQLDEEGPRIASWGRPPAAETFLRATLYPGYAQIRALERTKGFTMVGTATASIAATAYGQSELWDAESRRDEKRRALDEAGTAEERRLREAELSDAVAELAYAKDRRNLFLGVTAVCWGVSYLDALLFRPSFEVRRADEASVTLGVRSKTRLDAGLRSLVFPGLGQLYNGEPKKAGWLAVGGIGTGGWLVWRQDRYNESISELAKIDARIRATSSVPERSELEAIRAAQVGEVEDRHRERNVAALVMGGVWAVAIVDAVWAQEASWGGHRTRARGTLGWRADPVAGSLAADVRF